MPVESIAPDAQFSTLLRRLSASYEQLGHAYAEQHGIYSTDFHALLLVEQHERRGSRMTAGELASGLGLSSGAVTYLVERLTHSGHLEREVDPTDRRKVLLGCTRSGQRVARGFDAPVAAAVDQSLQGVDEDGVEQVRQVVSVLIHALGDQTGHIDPQNRPRAIA